MGLKEAKQGLLETSTVTVLEHMCDLGDPFLREIRLDTYARLADINWVLYRRARGGLGTLALELSVFGVAVVIILSFNSLASLDPLAIDDIPGVSNQHSRISLQRSSLAQFLRLLFNFLRLILLLYSYRSVLVLLHFFVLFLNAKPFEDLPELTEHD